MAATTTTTVHPRTTPTLSPPWHLHEHTDEDGSTLWHLVSDDYHTPIAMTAAFSTPDTTLHQQGLAIANLLHSAPELYAALQLALEYLQRYQQDTKAATWGEPPPQPRAPYQLATVLLECDAALRRARGQGW